MPILSTYFISLWKGESPLNPYGQFYVLENAPGHNRDTRKDDLFYHFRLEVHRSGIELHQGTDWIYRIRIGKQPGNPGSGILARNHHR